MQIHTFCLLILLRLENPCSLTAQFQFIFHSYIYFSCSCIIHGTFHGTVSVYFFNYKMDGTTCAHLRISLYLCSEAHVVGSCISKSHIGQQTFV